MEQNPRSVDEKTKGDELLKTAVRELRLRLNLSQDAFAELIGVSPRSVARFEGEQAPSVRSLIQLAQLARAKGFYDLARKFEGAFVGNMYRARPRHYSANFDSKAEEGLPSPADTGANADPTTGRWLGSLPEQQGPPALESPGPLGTADCGTWRAETVPSLATSIHRVASTAGYEHFRALFKELIIRSIDHSVESREHLFLLCAERIERDPRLAHLRRLLHEINTLVGNDVLGDAKE
ncbi:MAG: helix-turn-helix transcriptional regulator [Bryobacteraceae bacterium]